MAIAFNVAATPNNGTASPGSINAPGGRAVNDVLIVSYSQDSASRTVTTPSGWSLVEGPTTSSTQRGYTYARIADGTSADNFSATISGATNWLCNMVAYSGCDTSGAVLTTAIVAHSSDFDASSVTAMITPSVTTPAVSGCVLVGMFTADAASTDHSYSPTSTTPSVGTPVERYDNFESTGHLCSCGDDTVGLTLSQSTGYQMTATCNGAEVGTHYAFILAPAATGPSGAASVVFTATGSEQASVSGAAAVTFTGSGAASAAVTGAASVVFTASGAESAAVTGAASVVFTATGSVAGPGGITGTGSVVFTASGTESAAVTGAGSVVFTASGAESAAVTGAAGVTFTASSTALTANIAGAASVVFTGSGAAAAKLGSSTALVTFTATGTVSGGAVTPAVLAQRVYVVPARPWVHVVPPQNPFTVPADNRVRTVPL